MLRGFFGRSYAIRQIKMPAHILECVFHFDGPIGVQPAANNSIIADCIVAIQTKSRNMHGERIPRDSRFDVERTCLRIAAENTGHAFLVSTACIHGCGMNRVAGSDRQRWFIFCRKSPVENGGHEFVPLRRSRATFRNSRCSELMCRWMLLVVTVDEDHGSCDRAILYRAF